MIMHVFPNRSGAPNACCFFRAPKSREEAEVCLTYCSTLDCVLGEDLHLNEEENL